MPLELTPKVPPYYETGDGISIKQYIALLSQNGTDAPVATVLKNTLGESITWTRDSAGFYLGNTPTALFPVAKTTVLTTGVTLDTILSAGTNEVGEPSTQIFIATATHGGTNADDLLYITPIIITVYP